jgi:hypothetical protein
MFFNPLQILSADNFPHLSESKEGADINLNTYTKESPETDETDIESGTTMVSPSSEHSNRNSDTSLKSVDEDQLVVEIPSPGFQFASAAMPVGQLTNRQIPNLCRYVSGQVLPVHPVWRFILTTSRTRHGTI